MGKNTFGSIQPRQKASAPFLLTAHLRLEGSGKNARWTAFGGRSVLYWAQDGAVVDEQYLLEPGTKCSVACFLNATELATDLTTFHLAQSQERTRRAETARQSIVESLGKLDDLSQALTEWEAKSKRQNRLGGGGMALTGLGLVWVEPFFGSLLLGTGILTAKFAGTGESRRAREVRAGIRELEYSLKGELEGGL